ncbi:TPA: DUF4236 domain-containing protein [Escherichia coli]|nr:DUF4236 domain-containing protein [Escherichia coli]HAH8847037.1 DUF4236 domain-containing protein [Escherichia coli]
MGFKFRKRIKIAPGISINIGKSGITSATIGKRGASLNVGKNGVKATAGIPGSGLSYTSGNLLSGQKDVRNEAQPSPVLVLTNKQYRTLSADEKKAFKNAGGKVKFSIGEKIFILAVILIALGWLSDRHPPGKTTSSVTQEMKPSANN